MEFEFEIKINVRNLEQRLSHAEGILKEWWKSLSEEESANIAVNLFLLERRIASSMRIIYESKS